MQSYDRPGYDNINNRPGYDDINIGLYGFSYHESFAPLYLKIRVSVWFNYYNIF